ncbi:MAG: aldo/keto reductase [Theionarchaea archaeon]|nr:aldo/keto reductase [Theionarchaea archaeon]
MKYRNLGRHGLKISEISVGTMFHGSYIPREDSTKVLAEALNQGINFIDCADRYGIFDSELDSDKRLRAEIILGEFLKDYDREDLVISSKVFYKMRESPNSGGLSRKHIREEINHSLEYLQTDYLDMYFCHRPDRDTPLEETIAVMSRLVDEGLIHYWGTSWWPPVMVERTIALAKEMGHHPPAVEQPPYHFNARFIETDLFDVANYHGLGITAFEALSGGFYTGKYINGVPEGSRGSKTHFVTQERLEARREQLQKLIEIASSLDIPLCQLALAWVLRRPEISSTIMGASRPEQVVVNAGASDVMLDHDILDQIEEVLGNKPVSQFR